MFVDVCFPVRGDGVPTDHSYLLLAALSRVVRSFHEPHGPRFAPVNGDKGDRGRIRLFERSRLRVRILAERIAEVLPLTGRALQVGEHTVRFGVPTVAPLQPAPTLAARLVTFRNADEPQRFLDVARRKLDEAGIAGEPGIPLIRQGERAGEPRRLIVRIKDRRVVGYAMQVAELNAEESLRLQEQSLGGRTRIGCGFFVPLEPRLS